jgi:hypothetical protein
VPTRAPRRSWCALVVIVILAVGVAGGCATAPRPPASSPSTPASEVAAGVDSEPERDARRPRPPQAVPRWSVRLLPGLDVDVGIVATRLCFDGPAPQRVGPEHGPALSHLVGPARAVSADGVEVGALPVLDDGIDTSALPPGRCVAFDVDVEAAARAIDRREVAAIAGRALVVSPDVWLWRPKPWPPGVVAGSLVVDDEAKVALPFRALGGGRFEVRASAFALQSYSALGTFAGRRALARRGVVLDVVRLVSGGVDDARLSRWLDVAIDDVAAPLQRFPVDRVLVVVWPMAGERPILSAFLGRGGGASAVFLVADRAVDSDHDDVDDDGGRWVLTHELGHALLPPVRRADAWFNEGLTTWHQEVLPVAAGRRERRVASAQLAIGFRTGAGRARRDGLSLQRACAEMDRFGSYQHCYWGGAALVELLADDVGDDGVFALVQAVQALGPVDAAPSSALTLLSLVTSSPSASAKAKRAAKRLMALWQAHKDGLFPDVAAARDGDGLQWPDAS